MAFTLQAFLSSSFSLFWFYQVIGVIRRLYFFEGEDEVRANVCYSHGLVKVDYSDQNFTGCFCCYGNCLSFGSKKLLQELSQFSH